MNNIVNLIQGIANHTLAYEFVEKVIEIADITDKDEKIAVQLEMQKLEEAVLLICDRETAKFTINFSQDYLHFDIIQE